jgi:hypothetical protein
VVGVAVLQRVREAWDRSPHRRRRLRDLRYQERVSRAEASLAPPPRPQNPRQTNTAPRCDSIYPS